MKPSFLQPLQLGHLTLRSNLVQGPLAGYSSAPFRVLTEHYGQPGFCTTEMISAKDLVHRNPNPRRFVWRAPEEKILCYQLAANCTDALARACEIVTHHGADIIDLNCGCPVNKIRKKNSGSKLLDSPDFIARLVTTMKQHTDAVVSIKIRLHEENTIACAQAAQDSGADFITVHGRTYKERYDTPSKLERIAEVVDAMNIPVLANGDAEDAKSVEKIFTKTGAKGIMIARASVGQPWLFKKIESELNQTPFTPPSQQAIGEIFINHIEGLIKLGNEKLAVLQSRKFAKYYARTLPNKNDFIKIIQTTTDFKTLTQTVKKFF